MMFLALTFAEKPIMSAASSMCDGAGPHSGSDGEVYARLA
jgi:hypothetical protein